MMRDTLKDWLPITARNRVALGIAAVALLIFVICNFLPYYENQPHYGFLSRSSSSSYTSGGVPEYKCRFYEELWSDVFNPSDYAALLKSPSMDDFLSVISNLVFLFNSLTMLAIVPFWRVLHVSIYIRIPIAASNFYIAFTAFRISIQCQQWHAPDSTSMIYMLIGLATAGVGAALINFQNELGLRDELEVKKTMGG